jgi:hypothetical protein
MDSMCVRRAEKKLRFETPTVRTGTTAMRASAILFPGVCGGAVGRQGGGVLWQVFVQLQVLSWPLLLRVLVLVTWVFVALGV